MMKRVFKSGALATKTKYDVIIFPEMHGLGYYCMHAKKIGIDFEQTKLITMYHGPSEWHNIYNKSLPSTWSELAKFYLERQSCHMSDHIYFATNHAKEIAQKLGYFQDNPNRTSEVLLYPYNSIKNQSKKVGPAQKCNEVCFIGRNETRKDIATFLDSVLLLKDSKHFQKTTFTILGMRGTIDSIGSEDYLNNWLSENNIKLKIINDFGTEDVYHYLQKNSALAILASTEETMGYTLIECLVNSAPFICSDIAPFKEILTHFNACTSKTFISEDPGDLARKINSFLGKNLSPLKITNPHTLNKHLWQISICIIFFDRPAFLEQLLLSIEPISEAASEILIYINKATTNEALKIVENLKTRPKIKCIYDKARVSPGYARNVLAKSASNETILFIDDDNVLDFEAFKKILTSEFDEWDIICSPIKKFKKTTDKNNLAAKTPNQLKKILDENVLSQWVPLGNDLTLSVIENKIGDCNFLVKKIIC